MRDKERCPACGAHEGVFILYGRPTVEASEAARRGELHLGGCVVTGEDPTRHCRTCGHEWAAEADDDARP